MNGTVKNNDTGLWVQPDGSEGAHETAQVYNDAEQAADDMNQAAQTDKYVAGTLPPGPPPGPKPPGA